MQCEKKILRRCGWVNLRNPLSIRYHDREWSVPCHDDRLLFEMLILECFQAGLSWECILNKREGFRAAFDGFDPFKVSQYGDRKCGELLQDGRIVRNRLKIRAAVTNSRVFLAIAEEYGSFDAYIWRFTAGRSVRESCGRNAASPLSEKVARDLKKRGMKFTGSTTVHAYLQAIGVICAHEETCAMYRRREVPEER